MQVYAWRRPTMRHNFLTDRLLSIRTSTGREKHTLPSVLALLACGARIEFEALQPHQQHPWFAFLVQLAALATSSGALPVSEELWREALLGLTDQAMAPWCLLVKDLALPALLQPPVPEGMLKPLKHTLRTPGEIDVLIAAKNFDLKIRRVNQPEPEHWLFALVTKQTAEGVLGAGNYGIARMNGGTSSRPCVSIVSSLEWAPRFQRDVGLWHEHQERIQKEHGYHARGLGLLWLVPWDGLEKLARKKLHPFFIEICRRIRLTETRGQLEARTGNTKGTRIFNEGHNGNTGDIWTPLYLKKGVPTSLSLDEGGFHFRRVQDLLLQWAPHPAMTPIQGDAWLLAQSICRAQGKTLGYHERVVALPAEICRILGDQEKRQMLARTSSARIERFSLVQHGLLKPVLLALLQGVPEGRVDLRDTRVQTWLDRFEREVDAVFFPSLWACVSLSEEDSTKAWDLLLQELLDTVMAAAFHEVPVSLARREVILAGATRRFVEGKTKFFGGVKAA